MNSAQDRGDLGAMPDPCWTERWIPDALVIVIVLSIVGYIFALIWGFKPEVGIGSRAYQSVQAWGKGFWVLLEFAM